MNVYRILADASHDLAFLVLLFKLLKTRSAAGISGKTQIVYALVFCTRYLDLFTTNGLLYVTVFKILYIILEFLFIFLIFFAFKKTYEKKYDTARIEFIVIPCIIGGVIQYGFSYDNLKDNIVESFWGASLFLEAFAAVPQMMFICKAKRAEKYIIPYLVLLFAYRVLYIFNWIYRYHHENFNHPILYRCAFVQMFIYVSFFIYYFCYVKGKAENEYYASNITEFASSPAKQELLQGEKESDIPSVYVIRTSKDYAFPKIGIMHESLK